MRQAMPKENLAQLHLLSIQPGEQDKGADSAQQQLQQQQQSDWENRHQKHFIMGRAGGIVMPQVHACQTWSAREGEEVCC